MKYHNQSGGNLKKYVTSSPVDSVSKYWRRPCLQPNLA